MKSSCEWEKKEDSWKEEFMNKGIAVSMEKMKERAEKWLGPMKDRH